MTAFAWVAAGFLAGSVPFSFLAVRWLEGIDLREVGSGNAGATNVARIAGPAVGLAVLALDIAKGAMPVALAARWGDGPALAAAVAVAAVLGHVASPFLGFRGGKGVATAVGGLGVLAPLPLLMAVALFVVVVLRSRFVSLGSVVLLVSMPALIVAVAVWSGQPIPLAALSAAATIAVVAVARHAGNLARLYRGEELRLGATEEGGPR